ncbi:hypothetical protein [Streptomyces sp. NPDC005408]|uniref:hypothetical protein n=1 Tax=Streptomyces sp. NPDC005408 TaxID=3155341 RepID=UPI0033A8C861
MSVAVTPQGRAALTQLDAEARAVQEEILFPLTQAERAQLSAMLHRVFDHLRDGGAEH